LKQNMTPRALEKLVRARFQKISKRPIEWKDLSAVPRDLELERIPLGQSAQSPVALVPDSTVEGAEVFYVECISKKSGQTQVAGPFGLREDLSPPLPFWARFLEGQRG
jgi:hypothetical protein